jgi:hypothetical protein
MRWTGRWAFSYSRTGKADVLANRGILHSKNEIRGDRDEIADVIDLTNGPLRRLLPRA